MPNFSHRTAMKKGIDMLTIKLRTREIYMFSSPIFKKAILHPAAKRIWVTYISRLCLPSAHRSGFSPREEQCSKRYQRASEVPSAATMLSPKRSWMSPGASW